jgi:uncharacterized protein (TIGR03086 family)
MPGSSTARCQNAPKGPMHKIGNMDIREFDRRSVEWMGGLISQVTPEQLGLATPCAGWDLRDLLLHLVNQNRGFAAAARGNGADLSIWNNDRLGEDPVRTYAESQADLVEAFAAAGVLDRGFVLPEIRDGGPFPAPMAISFHFVDCLCHGWDVATTLGIAADPDPELVEHGLKVAAAVPDTPETRGEGFAFARAIPVADDAPPFHRLLAQLGRSATEVAD